MVTTLLLLFISIASFALVAPITGIMTVCMGTSTTLGDATAGGTWSSSNIAVATVDSIGSVTGISAGTVTITYTAGTFVTTTITVNPTPTAISGMNTLCVGSSIILTDTTSGGSWSISNPAVANLVSSGSTCTVTGDSAYHANIIYALGYGCSVSMTISVNALPTPIIGVSNLCNGTSAVLSDLAPGGTWSTGSAYFTVGSGSGNITGIAAGSGVVSYTLPTGCITTHPFTVLLAPGAISGSSSLCTGNTTNLTNPVGGGIWTSGSMAVAAIGSLSGVATGIAPGTDVITYTLGTGCSVTGIISVNPLPAPITGSTGLCAGAITTLSDASPGGTWSSSNVAIATIGATSGTATGLAIGSATVSYTVSTGCSSTTTINVYASPSVISGPTVACTGSTINLSDASSGGIWSSSNPLVAAAGSLSGVISGINTGTATITYTLGTGCTVSAIITVNASPNAFPLHGGGAYCAGDPGAIIGLDSSVVGINYQLFHAGTPVGSPVPGTGMPFDFGPQTITGAYTVVASNTAGCTRNMIGTANVTMNTLPGSFNVTVTGSSIFCAGSLGPQVNLSGSQLGVSYQLYNGSSVSGMPLPGTGSPLNFGYHAAAGTYTVLAINPTTTCQNNMAGSATLTVNPLPVHYPVTGGGGYCAGGAGVPVHLNGSQPGIYYLLKRNDIPTLLHLYGTGSALNFGFQTLGGTYSIAAADTSTGCSTNMTGSASVVVNPLPVIYTVTGGGSYCTGGTGVHITLSGSQTGIEYQLYHGGAPVGAEIAGTSSLIDFGPQTMPGYYTVVATNSATTCTKLMVDSGNINVYPLPAVHNVTGGGSYCGGGTGVHIGTDGSNIGVAYQLYKGVLAVGSLIAGTGAALDFGLQTATGTYTVVATNPGTSCSNNMALSATVSITAPVTPSVTMSVDPGDTVCSGTIVTYTAIPVNGGSSPVYQWTQNGIIVGSGSSKSLIPSEGDIIQVNFSSSAACALPATVNSSVTAHVITVPAITGTPATCLGNSTSLADTMAGGIWSTANPAVAIISTVGGATGVVTGISAGTVNMTYTIGMGCFAFVTVTVDALPLVTVSATAAACGGNYDLSAGGGTMFSWLPVTGLACSSCALTTANPSATTTYTVTVANAAGCTGAATVTVNGNRISGYISYSGIPSDIFKVWLIQFNPADSSIIALDSTLTCMDSGTPYYEFDGKPAGKYLVKAKLLGQIPGASGYIPTYSYSTPYWYAAASANHSSATDTLHISMVYGIVPAGPGFISGLISAGAGRGTSGDVPSQGMLVYLVDAISNFVLTYTYTDNAGAYSFSNIAEGNYLIYPENYSFTTIPSSVIMLSSTADSAAGVNFRQFNDSKVIRPVVVPSSVKEVKCVTGNGVIIFPNPTNGQVNIAWGQDNRGIANVTITGITGQSVYHTSINIDDVKYSGTSTVPVSTIDLTGYRSGVYILSVKGEQVNYSVKIVVK